LRTRNDRSHYARAEDLTEDEAKKGLLYLEDSRRISESIGAVEFASATDAYIAHYKATCIQKFAAQEAFGEPETAEQVLQRHRNAFRIAVEMSRDVLSLTMGSNLAIELRDSNHTIEACRLLKRLVAISKQHHGPEHKIT
jgi:hypothetical protein